MSIKKSLSKLMTELQQFLSTHSIPQRRLALHLGMDESQLSRYFTGRHAPSLETFQRLVEAAEYLAEQKR